MVTLSIDTIGEERFIRGFSRIERDVQDFQEPFRVILGDFREMEKRIFATEGSSEGEGSFKPLSVRYREWKEIFFPGEPIMVLRGNLRAALTGRAEGTIEKIEKRAAEFGTDIPYAHRHQMGTGGMPQRRFVQVGEEAKRRWARVVARWAMGLFEKYGITDYGSYIGEFD